MGRRCASSTEPGPPGRAQIPNAPERPAATLRDASSARCAGRLAAAFLRAVAVVARAALPGMPRRTALAGLVFACSLTALVPAALADTTPPTLGATAGGVTTFGRVIGTDIHLYFSEDIGQGPGNLPVPDAFFVKVDGVRWSIRPGSVRGGADRNELVLGDLSAPVVRGQTVSVAYVDSTLGDDAAAIQDLDGNDAEPFNFVTIDNGEENTTGRKPIMAFVSVERPHDRPLVLHWALVPTSYGADSYDVQYARTSERPVPEAAWFDGPQDLTFTGAVHAYAGEGTATFENLDSATYYSMRVRGTNSHGAGDWAGPVGAWTNYFWPGRATPVTRSARVLDGGTDLIMPFDRNLDRRAGRTPPKELFEVTAGGAPVTIGEFLIRDNEPRNVYLTGLSPAIRRGQTVTVSYRDPTPIDGTAVLQGTNGADVHSFSNARVKNRSLLVASDPGVGPAPASARVDADGDTVIVSFDEAVDGTSIPGSGAFAVTVGGTGVTVSGAGSGDRAKDVHVEIAGAIVRGQAVTVSYTRPTSGNVIQDTGGNDAESFTGYPVVSAQAPPPPPLTAAFEDLPGFHDGSTAFTVRLAFSEEFPVTEEAIRAGLTVTGGAPGAVAQTESGKNRRWDITVTPSVAEAVSIALAPKESCGAEGAICTGDGRGLPETVEAEVPGGAPTQVVSARVSSGPGLNGTWDTGETVVVEVRFSREVSLSGPAGATPAIGIALDGTRRDADYESGSGSHALRFEYEVAAADDGATRARVVANSLEANGVVIGDAEGYEAELGFSVAPELSVADAEGTEGTDTAIAFTVTLAPAAATEVTVAYATADGTATAPADYTSTSSTLTFDPGQTSKTIEVPIVDDLDKDSGETFTLVLSEPSGAVLADAEATGTIRNTEAEAAPLSAEFRGLPDAHGGAAFTFELRFSEEFPLGYERLRDAAFRVTNGSVTAARRVTAGKHRVWDVTVTPSGGDAVTVALPETTDCSAAGAICAGQRMLAAVSATVPETAPAGAAFRVRLADVPREHAGTGEITFRVLFNKHPGTGYSYKTLRDYTLKIRKGGDSLTPKVRRLNAPHNDRWEVKVTPGSKEDLTVSVGPFSLCSDTGAVCTANGEVLANKVERTIDGPPGLTVADGRVHESAANAAVAFAVTLGRASRRTVKVDYATGDGPGDNGATAGHDYEPTSGTLVFAPGETAKTVSVPVFADDHDEGEETFTLALSNPRGGNAWLKDATAIGTIENTGPMPRAWLARFGRTVAEQVIDAVEGRFAASRRPGVEMRLAGRAVGGSGADAPEDPGSGAGAGGDTRATLAADAEARSSLAAMSKWLQGSAREDGQDGRRAGYESRAVTGRDLLTGTSFALTGEAGGAGASAGTVSLWGRGAVSRFDGRDGDLTLSGEVTSAMLGADWLRDAWTAGLLVSHSRGEGSYRGAHAGTVSSTLTGLYPYGRYLVNERLSVWGVAGYGEGTLTLTPDGGKAIETDIDLMMGAVGARGVAVEAPAEGGVEFSITSDAMAVRTSSEKVPGLAAADAGVTRLRLGLNGTWRGLAAGGGELVPRLEVGLRHDGGDAETGFGLDLGGGLSWSHRASGLSAELSGRGLLTHESAGFRDRGLSGSLGWDPGRGTGRGPKLTLAQTVGASASGGMDALLGRETLGGLAANDNGDDLENRRLNVGIGYGFAAFGDRFTSTPELGLGLSQGRREYSLGWRLGLAPGSGSGAGQTGPNALELRLQATRSESADGPANPGSGSGAGSAAEHGIGFRLTARW